MKQSDLAKTLQCNATDIANIRRELGETSWQRSDISEENAKNVEQVVAIVNQTGLDYKAAIAQLKGYAVQEDTPTSGTSSATTIGAFAQQSVDTMAKAGSEIGLMSIEALTEAYTSTVSQGVAELSQSVSAFNTAVTGMVGSVKKPQVNATTRLGKLKAGANQRLLPSQNNRQK